MGRFELRLADGAVNPYLLQAVILGKFSSCASSFSSAQVLANNMLAFLSQKFW